MNRLDSLMFKSSVAMSMTTAVGMYSGHTEIAMVSAASALTISALWVAMMADRKQASRERRLAKRTKQRVMKNAQIKRAIR